MGNFLHRKCCGCDKPCNPPCECTDNVFAMKPYCAVVPECFNPEKCSETFATDCIVYTGDSIADLGIIKGARLTDVIQIVIGAITNPGCTLPSASPLCLSVVGLGSTVITQTSATFVWTPIIGATMYQLEYKVANPLSPTFILNPSTVNSYDTIGGLQPNTQYYVRAKTMCGANSCYSLTLLITTKP